MSKTDAPPFAKPSFGAFKPGKRTAVRLSQGELVKTGSLSGLDDLPLLVEPAVDNLNPFSWAESNRGFVDEKLLAHGAVLFRGFRLAAMEDFERFTRSVSPDLLDYLERAAPRTEVASKVFTSTEYPADEPIPLHHEMSYSHNWPVRLFFYCDTPPETRGSTPIASDRLVWDRIDPEIKARFIAKKVMYVRNYGEGVDLPWREVFQTEDRSVVEDYCRRFHTDFEWRDGDRLRTRQVRQAVATHPKTGDTVWFNHAHMFHESNVKPEVRQALRAEFAEDELPRNAFYGDGSRIEDEVLDHVRGVYNAAALRFPWQRGDVLLVDNFLVSHGRDPFTGPRRILVAMADLYSNEELYADAPAESETGDR